MPIEETLEIYRRTIPDTPVLSVEINGESGAYIELQSCSLGTVILNPTPDPVIAVQGKGSSLLFDTDVQKTLTNTTFFIPGKRVVKWEAHHRLDFITLIYTGAWADPINSTATDYSEPVAIYDPLLAAITDRISREMMNRQDDQHQYLKELLAMFATQLCREVEQANTTALPKPRTNNAELIKEVKAYMQYHIGERLASSDLANIAGVSESHFRQLFKNMTGQTVHQYHLSIKLERARQLLMTTDMPLALISSELGFSSQAHMSTAIRKLFGVTPLSIRKGS